MSPEVSQDPTTSTVPAGSAYHFTWSPRCSQGLCPRPPPSPCPLTKPLPMTRQSLEESQSLLVKWNSPARSCGTGGPGWSGGGTGAAGSGAGQVLMAGGGAGRRGGVTSSCCGISCMISFCSPGQSPCRRRGSGAHPSAAHPRTLPALTGSPPGSRRPGREGPASASRRWSPSRVCAGAGQRGLTGHGPAVQAGCPPARTLNPSPHPADSQGAGPRALTSCHSGRRSRPAACC